MHIFWLILIGFVAGVIAKFIHPGSNEPSGFILTTLLGIAGAFVATYLGQALGWYQADQGAGLIGAVVGAIIVLVVWGFFARRDAPFKLLAFGPERISRVVNYLAAAGVLPPNPQYWRRPYWGCRHAWWWPLIFST